MIAAMAVLDNLAAVRKRIEAAHARAGGAAPELVAVSKKVPIELLRCAVEGGVRVFGESYVQEALGKVSADLPGAEFHLIGRVQRNKARLIAGRFSLIHSLDREELAAALSAEAHRASVVQDVLMQVNVSGETSKAGISPENAVAAYGRMLTLPALKLRGLMCIGTELEDPSQEQLIRKEFRLLASLRREIEARWSVEVEHLSMGMSADFEIAIEEGSTMVRIGSAIFGPREN